MVVMIIGTKYAQITGGAYSKNFLKRSSVLSQKTRPRTAARKANRVVGSVIIGVFMCSPGICLCSFDLLAARFSGKSERES